MTFSTPDKLVSLTLNIIGFLDDTTCMTAGDPSKPLLDMLRRMQHDAQLWNDLLWASGGRLEVPKCSHHTIHYLFHDSDISYLQHHHQHNISLIAPKGDTIPIRPKNVFTPRKNLGHHKALGGNYISQKEAILTKAA